MVELRGFIVSAWDEFRPSRGSRGKGVGDRMLITGRLEDGRSFAALRSSPGPALFVARDRSEAALSAIDAEVGLGTSFPPPEDWSDMAGRPLSRLCLPPGSLRASERALSAAGIAVEGLDRRRADEELAALGIRGPVVLRGEEKPGKRVDAVFVEPELAPLRERPRGPGPERGAPDAPGGARLRWMALDIETDREGRVVAVSLAEPARLGGGDGGRRPDEVLFLMERGKAPSTPGIEVFPDESALLGALAARIVRRDPDVITGWNVLDFDFKVLVARYATLGLVFDAGRTESPVAFVERTGRRASLDLPGRAVLDAMRLARAGGSGAHYEDMSLETVAREVLGEGKSVSSRGEEKIEELEQLRSRDPDAFCAYCLQDSRLVLRILEETGLDELTARRAALTGVSLDLAWTSIPAFERVYGSELRSRRVAVPPKVERRVSGAAGGTVLEASAGLFPRVLVFDFRSLYPSIMRTFNVDPLAYARAEARLGSPQIASQDPRSAQMSSRQSSPQIAPQDSRSAHISSFHDDICAPNGARFDRAPGVMPGLIAEYSAERERALAEGDPVAAYVYKILQNSFYGVLGAEGCRYARTELAGAITSFGKKFLVMSRDFFEARGLRVLYGDTDSVFVLYGSGEEPGFERLMAMGGAAAEELNAEIGARVESEYGLASYLRIRCEKVYEKFLITRLKSDALVGRAEGGEGGRGRSKGYAGLLLSPDGSASVEVKGMEAARTDFTPLARDFQVALLALVFSGAGEDALRDFCRAEEAALRRGERDDKLVYRKTLRRSADDYASESPQVRAARLLGWTTRGGRVSYVMTKKGAEPVGPGAARGAASGGALFDYDHYVAKQLLPIAVSILDAVGFDARTWLEDKSQYELDFGN